MKKIVITSVVFVTVLSLGIAYSQYWDYDTTGNGAPKAKLLAKLNIIGVDNTKNVNMNSGAGNVIFVSLYGESDILLVEDVDDEGFAVLDKNGTDGEASFRLPNPDLDPYLIGGDMTGIDTVSEYSVFARSLGKPNGIATITTCAELVDGTGAGLFAFLPSSEQNKLIRNAMRGAAYCSIQPVPATVTERTKGKSIFTNVTAELLTIVFQIDLYEELDPDTGDPIVLATYYVRVPIFDPLLQNEFWYYDNNGLKNLQIRFYDTWTDVQYADEPYLP